jgi:hypothetical protein
MSSASHTALYSKLTGAGALTALLGAQADGLPAVFNASLNKLSSPVFPIVTFREDSGTADARFAHSTVDEEIYNIEVWAATESALVVPAIFAQIDALLHNGTLTLASGVFYDCYRLSQTPDMYDDQLNLHFGLYRYRLVLSRS